VQLQPLAVASPDRKDRRPRCGFPAQVEHYTSVAKTDKAVFVLRDLDTPFFGGQAEQVAVFPLRRWGLVAGHVDIACHVGN
jgi:hypothetical protein